MPKDRNLKRLTAEEHRRSMNERRHEYAHQIRKKKKSQQIMLKRRYNGGGGGASDTPMDTTMADTCTAPRQGDTATFTQLSRNYMQKRDMPNLTALSSALATCTSTTQVLELKNEQEQFLLCNALAASLGAERTLEERLLASRILINLAAMTTSNQNDDASYYTKQPEGWCHILIHSEALPALASSLAGFATQVDPSYMSSDSPLLQVCSQSCWAVGNLAGDSQVARDALRMASVVPSLCSVLQAGLELHHTDICRNAAWALSNLTRGVTTSGKEFCGPTLLTPTLLAFVLMSPEQQASATVVTSWWGDVAKEACWILAFLTAREDEVVDYLCQPSREAAFLLNGNQNVTCAALAHRLKEACNIIKTSQQQATTTTTRPSTVQLRALQMTIPSLRSIGNIATACQGRQVATLLQETSILESLTILIQAGCNSAKRNGDINAVAVEATWAAGTLLCDAGIDQHPSTTIAAPALLPTLCQVVVDGSAKLDLKRETVSALWNAVAAPPNQDDMNISVANTSRPIRDEFLRNIALEPCMVTSLTSLLSSTDADAVFSSIQLLDAVLRRLSMEMPSIKREFLEADGVDALEAVCDRASQDNAYGDGRDWDGGNGGTSSESAEIAADLIDDLFSNEDDDQEMVTMQVPDSFMFSPIAVEGQQPVFDFSRGGSMQRQPQQPMGAFPDASDGTVGAAGRGRGRGKPVPSWMRQQQSS